jgi:NAD(P)-dependent dehydrogenase (short-subunit alcohol dehydrogenase family)
MKNSIYKNFNLKNKTAVLTGSAGRLGNEFAHILCEAGANVILVDIDSKKNKKLEYILKKKFDNKIISCDLDISNQNSVKELKKEILAKFGRIDILINNAFFNPSINQTQKTKKFETFPLEIWNKVIGVNLTGVFVCSQEIGSLMAKQKGGVIVNISSIYGLVGADQRIYGDSGLNSQPSYAATKGAIVNFTRYLASYWHGKNIRVNTLTLGGVLDKSYMKNSFIKKYSEKTILGRMANKNEYNGALLFLVSDASSYMTGANLIVDGGWTAW